MAIEYIIVDETPYRTLYWSGMSWSKNMRCTIADIACAMAEAERVRSLYPLARVLVKEWEWCNESR